MPVTGVSWTKHRTSCRDFQAGRIDVRVLVYKMKSKLPRSNELPIKRGDFIFSSQTIPNPNAILARWSKSNPKIIFSPYLLQHYLQFLETIILNERLILTNAVIHDSTDKKLLDKNYIRELGGVWRKQGILDIEDDLVQQLYDHDILKPLLLSPDSYSPKFYIDKYLTLSSYLNKELNIYSKIYKRNYKSGDSEIAKRGGYLTLVSEYGVPLAISEFARDKRIPYLLGDIELSNISKLDEIETKLSTGIISFLKENLDKGTQLQIDWLSSIGTPLTFPKTPLAWKIIQNSNQPKDLIQVALQLRTDFKSFRRNMISLEEELYDETTTLQRKRKIMNEVNFMAKGLWSEEKLGYQKISQEITDFIKLIPSDFSFNPAREIPSITSYLISKPINTLIDAFQRRKIKTLIKARKDFMKSKLWIKKLSSIFSFPEEAVRESLYEMNKKMSSKRNS